MDEGKGRVAMVSLAYHRDQGKKKQEQPKGKIPRISAVGE
jgi:hypothetical protein